MTREIPGRSRPPRQGKTGASTGPQIDSLVAGIDAANGEFSTEQYLVTGLTGDPAAILVNALNSPNVPKVGDLHPFGTLLPVSRVEARPASDGSTTSATVTVTYGIHASPPDFPDVPDDSGTPILEITTTLQPMQTNFNTFGQPLLVTHQNRWESFDSDGDGEADTSQNAQHIASVNYFIPMTTLIYRRREVTNPLEKARINTGKIDGDSPFIFGEVRPHHWLVTAITGATDDGGRSYKVQYEFQRHPETWDTVVTFIDPETGRPPSDVATAEAGGVVFDPTAFLQPLANRSTSIYWDQLFQEINFRAVFNNFTLG